MLERSSSAKVLNWICPLLLIAICVGAITYLQSSRLSQLTSRNGERMTNAEAQQQVNQTKANLKFLRELPSFGFDNLIAAWTLLQFHSYFGDLEARSKTGYSLSPEFFEIIVERDPRFVRSYIPLLTSVSMYAGLPERTDALLNKGLQSLSPEVDPQAYFVWRYKAVNELLLLGDSKAAKRSYEKAAEWAEISPDTESDEIANISRQTAHFLTKNPNSRRVQASAWLTVLGNAPDQPTRELAISRIQKLGGKVSISPQGEVRVQMPEQD